MNEIRSIRRWDKPERKKMASKNYKISIIIPCYNAEQFVDRCLEFVINQTIGLEHIGNIVNLCIYGLYIRQINGIQ